MKESEASRSSVDSDVEEKANEQAPAKVIEEAIEHDELGNDDDDMQLVKENRDRFWISARWLRTSFADFKES